MAACRPCRCSTAACSGRSYAQAIGAVAHAASRTYVVMVMMVVVMIATRTMVMMVITWGPRVCGCYVTRGFRFLNFSQQNHILSTNLFLFPSPRNRRIRGFVDGSPMVHIMCCSSSSVGACGGVAFGGSVCCHNLL